uniref:Protein kinase domain-containing protein n=1 Tax=Lotharella oceanica TaxID=641309 RepID=A0A7S2XEE8_9EUKA|mmetsp:Transcript_35198/g.65203  ORF Transcript_35198/g.65203 Transcript_35198/m.65203 type:complete len:382 (+) Transcript_35198:529-1674(+)
MGIEIIEELEKGIFSVSHCCEVLAEDMKHMGKVVLKRPLNKNYSLEMKELTARANLPEHPSLLKFLGLCLIDSHLCTITTYCDLGSLEALHTSMDLLEESMLKNIVLSVCSGLEHMHMANIVHRDICCRNILMTADKKIKIAGYGLSRIVAKNFIYVSVGSTSASWAWMPPEFISKQHFSPKGDMWSFGVAPWEILNRGDDPATNLVNSAGGFSKTFRKLVTRTIALKIREEQLKENVLCCKLIKSCLVADPAERPSALGVLTFVKTGQQVYQQLARRSSSLPEAEGKLQAMRRLNSEDYEIDTETFKLLDAEEVARWMTAVAKQCSFSKEMITTLAKHDLEGIDLLNMTEGDFFPDVWKKKGWAKKFVREMNKIKFRTQK